MPSRPLTPCRKVGCPNLVVAGQGYCPVHKHVEKEAIRENFAILDSKKTPEQKAFYQSHKWHTTSLQHRQREPLCRRCKAKGFIVPAQMVHHNPSVEELLAKGLSPFDHRYLESLCNDCHLGELREKKKKKSQACLLLLSGSMI